MRITEDLEKKSSKQEDNAAVPHALVSDAVLLALLQAAFIILKLCSDVDWSWTLTLSPLIFLVSLAAAFIVALLAVLQLTKAKTSK
jgi:hypothetical protein